ncbi:MAG: hypothetical protein DWQ34_19520 [Planctomycetota bacterium]|nr:MAG: hypothetical protein DWQ29_15405 [Planctomycetota bacterium]REJ89447.1 MAG: hypothetical protein DWQ34_19520 [Planctomycetota bacterium]REK28982.1 MAG: hypothetical protein DWQ41_05400 [Planctomycetota bacterium]REK39584.1 MAG: hypothetical protein DWQ45_01545 [Planctomycetota bacterium]
MIERFSHRRREVFRTFCLLVLLAVAARTAPADEPYLKFLEGLRRQGYHDYALIYLDQISEDPDLPADVREVLPYERAVTLLEGAASLTNSKNKREQLDAAQAAFEQFTSASPDHPLAGRANTETAKILMERAKVEIWDAEDPANSENRSAFQQRAREYIDEARAVFEKALEQHLAAVREFPLQIPEEEKVLIAQREEAEGRYLNALLNVVECTYWKAQTYDRGSDERTALLEQAVEEYNEIYTEHRLQTAGLIARLWQGKCFEEMDRIREALGIYNEILGHPGSNRAMTELKARAQRFRLICLNHDIRNPEPGERNEYRLVIEEATDWLSDAGAMARTDIGMGIRYEMARAQEQLGTLRTTPPADAQNYLTQARLNAQTVARYPGELKQPALALVRRVAAATGRPEEDPEDFETAYGLALQYISDTTSLNDSIEQAQAEGRTEELSQLVESRTLTAAEATRLFDIALRLADETTDPQQVATALSRLPYGYFLQNRYYESAAAADYALLHIPDDYDDLRQTCSYLELFAYDAAFTEADPSNREFEESRVIATAERLIERWPDSDYATDARGTIARMYLNRGEMAKAGEWYAKVPSTAKGYARSQILAGSSYWDAYNTTAAKPEAEREVDQETLNAWRTAAETHLQTGIDVWQAQLPEESKPPREFVIGKLTLVEIRNLNGVYTTTDGVIGAIELLTADPHSVLKSIEVAPGEERPTDPSDVRSARIAALAYQHLLRAYIGIRNLEAASDARLQLEQIAGGEDSAALTAIYVEFGKELQSEMEQLLASGQTERLNDVRQGFEEFLDSVAQREDQTYGSLLWMAETYTSLGEGSQDAPERAGTFFAKAAETYERMLNDAAVSGNPKQETVVKLRLADCRRRGGDFSAGEDVLLEAVQTTSDAPNVQFEAALFYEQWAKSSSAQWEKYETAINGSEEQKLWGWSGLCRRLWGAIMEGNQDTSIAELHTDARYHLADCQREFGLQQPDQVKSDKLLNEAKGTVENFVRISYELPPDEFRRFDELYQEIRSDLGEPTLSLAEAVGSSPTGQHTAAAVTPEPGGSPAASRNPSGDGTDAADQPAGPSTNVFMIVVLVVVGIAAVAGLYFLAVGQDKKRHQKIAAAAASSGKSRRKSKR